MIRTLFLASILLVSACATNAPREARVPVVTQTAGFVVGAPTRHAVDPAAPTPQLAETTDTFTAVKTVTSDEADNGRVCEMRQRPGSRMAQKYCYTRQQYTANQELRDEAVRQQIDELQREQRLLENQRQQMEIERRRPRAVFGGR